jgi:hypothetical protein
MAKKDDSFKQKKELLARITGKPELTNVKNERDLDNLMAMTIPNPKTYANGGGTRLVKS